VGVTPDILRPCLVVLLRHASDGVAAVPRVNRVCPLWTPGGSGPATAPATTTLVVTPPVSDPAAAAEWYRQEDMMNATSELGRGGGVPEAGIASGLRTAEGRVVTVTGGDWYDVFDGPADPIGDERIVVNLGPVHPSSHGVCRMVLELNGETVTGMRVVIGYLHTGIEKNLEFRNWLQGTMFVTRMDYLAPMFNETAYSLAVEKLLGIEDQVPERATTIRVLMMELNRISSHLLWLATTGMELGAISIMLYGLRERELILSIFEIVTGLRMNAAFVRPGGVAQDVPDEAIVKTRQLLRVLPERLDEYEDLLSGQLIWQQRTKGIVVADRKIAWPAQLGIGIDGLGNSLEYVAKIMGQSMESLIHHFKLVTEGFRVPVGQVYIGIESPRGELGVHAVSDGGTRPYRVHFRDPSFVNLQALPAIAEGNLIADLIAGGASLDPVMGGCDR
jgi:NADH:ubiquinone oxidoreductase subunit D